METLYLFEKNGAIRAIYDRKKGGLWQDRETRKLFARSSVVKNANGFDLKGAGFDIPKFEIPSPRFQSTRQIPRESMFKIEHCPDGTFRCMNVPLYKTHPDTRRSGHVSTREFLDRIVRNFYMTKAASDSLFPSGTGWLPKWHLGHTPDDPDAPERECYGFIDNIYRCDDFLFGDITGLDKSFLEHMVNGRYPDRSAEIDTRRAQLLSVAALGFRTPHFKLPQMRPDVMRQHYQRLGIHLNSFSDVQRFDCHIDKEILMGGKKKVSKNSKTREINLSPEQRSRYMLRIAENNEAMEEFVTLKSEAIEAFAEKNNGMMPNPQQLQQIVAQLLNQMMGQQMNAPGNYQMNVSDILDSEGRMHHSGGEPDFGDDTTATKGSEDDNLQKGPASGDTGVNKTHGQPTTDKEGTGDPNTKTISSPVSKSVSRAIGILKNAMAPDEDNDEVVNALDLVESSLVSASEQLVRHGKALKNISVELEKTRNDKRHTAYTSRLRALFDSGSAAVNSKQTLDKHLNTLMKMDEELAEEYLTNLEAIETSPVVSKHRRERLIEDGDDATYASRRTQVSSSEEGKSLARIGVDADTAMLLDLWS